MLRRSVLPALLALFHLLLSAPAAAQEDPLAGFSDPLRELQRLLPTVPENERSDLAIGRALARAEAPPAGVQAMDSVGFLIPGDPEWEAAAAWAAAEPQQDLLKAIENATDRRENNAFALPYGTAAPADLRGAGFWIELEDGKLYQARFHYLDALESLSTLVWIDANRLAEAGKHSDAAERLIALVRLGRQLADRPLVAESAAGYTLMITALEQLRDLSYRTPDMFDERLARRTIRLLEDRTLMMERLRFPEGGRVVAQQAVLDAFERLGDVDPVAFSTVVRGMQNTAENSAMPGVGAALAESHADYYATLDMIDSIYANWLLRWPLGPYDIIMERPSTYLTVEPSRFGLVMMAAGPGDILFELRRRTRSALAGTKLGIGVMAYRQKYGSWPSPLVAIRPAFIREIDVDPYDPKQATLMRYFVPIRDQRWGPRETPSPHEIRVQYSPDLLISNLIDVQAATRFSDAEAVQSVAAFIAALTSLNIEPRNVDERVGEIGEDEINRLIPAHLADRVAGLDPAGRRRFALQMALIALNSPDWQELREWFGAEDDRRSRRRGRRGADPGVLPAGAEMRPVRNLATAQARAGAPLAARLQRLANNGDAITFTVELDETDFVIYSVGEDAVFDFAREVGIGGADIIYWPPVLTLVREHVSN